MIVDFFSASSVYFKLFIWSSNGASSVGGIGRLANGEDATALKGVEVEAFYFGEDGVADGAGIQPKIFAAFFGDFGEELYEDGGADVDGDGVELGGNVFNGWECFEAFDFGFGGVDGVDVVAGAAECADGHVAVASPVVRSANHSGSFHAANLILVGGVGEWRTEVFDVTGDRSGVWWV